MNERCVTGVYCARADLVFGPLRIVNRGGHLRAGGVSPLSLPTFFAAAKKVGAAPHRGEANRPLRMQGKANASRKQPKTACAATHIYNWKRHDADSTERPIPFQ